MEKLLNDTRLASIIILNFNGLKYLKDCLNSIYKKTKYPNYEVILVDNASSDGSVDFVEKNFPKVKIIKNSKNLGFAQGNNIGTKFAKGDFIVLLNNDTEVTEGWLCDIVKVAEADPKIGVCGSLPFWYDYKDYMPKLEGCLYGSAVAGAAMLLKKDLIKKIGLFDPSYFIFFEDTEMCWRYLLLGYKIVVDLNSIVLHKKGVTTKKLPRPFTIFHFQKNKLMSILKIFSFRIVIKLLFQEFICLPISLLRDKMLTAAARLKAFFWVFLHLKEIILKREKIQRKRVTDDRVLLKLIEKDREIKINLINAILKEINKAEIKNTRVSRSLKENLTSRLYLLKLFQRMGFPLHQ